MRGVPRLRRASCLAPSCDRDAEYLRVADHDLLQVLGPVVFEPLSDTEAIEQRLVSRPFLVVAPTSVKCGRSILMVRADGPWPRTMSIAKSSIAG